MVPQVDDQHMSDQVWFPSAAGLQDGPQPGTVSGLFDLNVLGSLSGSDSTSWATSPGVSPAGSQGATQAELQALLSQASQGSAWLNGVSDPVMDDWLNLDDDDEEPRSARRPAQPATPHAPQRPGPCQQAPILPEQSTTEAGASPPFISDGPPLTRPSHQYDLYRQQTGIVPGALDVTHSLNQGTMDHTNSLLGGFAIGDNAAYSGNPNDAVDQFNFNTPVSQGAVSGGDPFPSITVDPSSLCEKQQQQQQQQPDGLVLSPTPTQPSNVGRLWPGMHQQAAQSRIASQRQGAQQQQQQQQRAAQGGEDPVQQQISRVLGSLRPEIPVPVPVPTPSAVNQARTKKEEEEMDEDERLLNSEEGKKLDSKLRRQLRNKVSARQFRSRRKGEFAD